MQIHDTVLCDKVFQHMHICTCKSHSLHVPTGIYTCWLCILDSLSHLQNLSSSGVSREFLPHPLLQHLRASSGWPCQLSTWHTCENRRAPIIPSCLLSFIKTFRGMTQNCIILVPLTASDPRITKIRLKHEIPFLYVVHKDQRKWFGLLLLLLPSQARGTVIWAFLSKTIYWWRHAFYGYYFCVVKQCHLMISTICIYMFTFTAQQWHKFKQSSLQSVSNNNLVP